MITPQQLPFVRRRYNVDYCVLCNLALEYCRCGTTAADELPKDGAESGLVKRIREARQQAGGR